MIDVINWNLSALAKALKLTQNGTKSIFCDARLLSFVLEKRIAREIKGKRVSRTKHFYGILGPGGEKIEVRCLTRHGIGFGPAIFYGRKANFDLEMLNKKLETVDFYYVVDAEKFPHCPVWVIGSEFIKQLYNAGTLGKNAFITRKKFLTIFGRR